MQSRRKRIAQLKQIQQALLTDILDPAIRPADRARLAQTYCAVEELLMVFYGERKLDSGKASKDAQQRKRVFGEIYKLLTQPAVEPEDEAKPAPS